MVDSEIIWHGGYLSTCIALLICPLESLRDDLECVCHKESSIQARAAQQLIPHGNRTELWNRSNEPLFLLQPYYRKELDSLRAQYILIPFEK